MNFFQIIWGGCILIAIIFIYIIYRDRRDKKTFIGQHKTPALVVIFLLAIGIVMALDARYVEPNLIKITRVERHANGIIQPIKIVFFSDIHLGEWKNAPWAEKAVKKITELKPDLVAIGGDLIANNASAKDEALELSPFKKLPELFPTYYILGNHEYGVIRKSQTGIEQMQANRVSEVEMAMQSNNIPLLRNELICKEIKNQKICFFGVDDVWGGTVDYSPLKDWDKTTPLIILAHNPDSVISYPKELPPPILMLSGHTHGGQVRLPLIGPLGNAEINLPKKFYAGLNFWNNVPVFTTVGLGESGDELRLFNLPEIVELTITP